MFALFIIEEILDSVTAAIPPYTTIKHLYSNMKIKEPPATLNLLISYLKE